MVAAVTVLGTTFHSSSNLWKTWFLQIFYHQIYTQDVQAKKNHPEEWLLAGGLGSRA